MRYQVLLWYWLAVAAAAVLAFSVPYAGFVIGIGALLYFLYAIGFWLARFVFFPNAVPRTHVRGMARLRFFRLLAGATLALTVLFLLFEWRVLACLGGALLLVCGEQIVLERARRAPGQG